MFWTCAEEVWRILNMELTARRKKRPQRKFMNVIKEDMEKVV